ncbi:MAG TPA: cytochrome C biogenesis protein CcsA, partial [Pseudomonas sp.]|nr:cytochrome C biogenesis protein CcsA [Pseudomonas sp.]
MKHLMISALGAAALLASGSLFATDGETLYKTKACVACHQIDTKVVGPS